MHIYTSRAYSLHTSFIALISSFFTHCSTRIPPITTIESGNPWQLWAIHPQQLQIIREHAGFIKCLILEKFLTLWILQEEKLKGFPWLASFVSYTLLATDDDDFTHVIALSQNHLDSHPSLHSAHIIQNCKNLLDNIEPSLLMHDHLDPCYRWWIPWECWGRHD